MELLGESSENLLAKAGSDQIALWTDEKRKEFVDTFDKRSRAACYILRKTSEIILDRALERHFVGINQVRGADNYRRSYYDHSLADKGTCGDTIGGRSISDLAHIAEERAELILQELPPLKSAVRIIDVETAKKLERKEKIMEELRTLKEKLEDPELSGPMNMADIDQNMTIGDFRKLMKERVVARRKLLERMNELALEGNELEEAINKKLYYGLPGLSDAVLSVAKQHLDRATALDELNRRVGERVMFGDSQAALEMLKGFEKDEETVPENIKEEFKSALEQLKVSRKQLVARKTKK
jgi:hypothetical protein